MGPWEAPAGELTPLASFLRELAGMAHDDERQERDDFEPTIKRPDPERVVRDTTPTDPEEHSLDIPDGADPRVQQPGD